MLNVHGRPLIIDVLATPMANGNVRALLLPALWSYKKVGEPVNCQPFFQIDVIDILPARNICINISTSSHSPLPVHKNADDPQ